MTLPITIKHPRCLQNDGTAVTTYEYDLANRLEHKDDGVNRTTYTYDADGNRLTVEEPSGDVTTSLWSYENQQVGVELPSGDVVTYAYAPATVDSVELRVAMVTDVGIVHALWDGQNLLRETDDLGSVEAEYTLAPQPFGNLVSQRRDSDSTFYQFDGQGSTSALTDDTEAVTDSYFYHTFGKVRTQSGTTTNPYQWLGMLGRVPRLCEPCQGTVYLRVSVSHDLNALLANARPTRPWHTGVARPGHPATQFCIYCLGHPAH